MGDPNSSHHGWDSSWYSRSREKGCLSKVSCVKSVWWPILLRKADDGLWSMVIVKTVTLMLIARLAILNETLAHRTFLVGERLSLADLAMAITLVSAFRCRDLLGYWVHFQKFWTCSSNNWKIAKVCSWWGVEVSASAPSSMVEYGPSSGEHDYVCGFLNKKERREVFYLTCDDCVLC